MGNGNKEDIAMNLLNGNREDIAVGVLGGNKEINLKELNDCKVDSTVEKQYTYNTEEVQNKNKEGFALEENRDYKVESVVEELEKRVTGDLTIKEEEELEKEVMQMPTILLCKDNVRDEFYVDPTIEEGRDTSPKKIELVSPLPTRLRPRRTLKPVRKFCL